MTFENYDRKVEVEAILAEDESLLGRIWRGDREGMTPEEHAEAAGAKGTGFVYNYRRTIQSLLDGVSPTSPSRAIRVARTTRTWLKHKELSPELRQHLVDLEAVAQSIAEDRSAQEYEEQVAVKATVEAESKNQPGVYVYTLPHYLRHLFDEETGRTLYKVGHSSADAVHRFNSQGRFTALPEDPVLLRIYPANDSSGIERKFHEWLDSADHTRSRTRRSGREWFLTSLKFLDRIAASEGLEIQIINDEFVSLED